jgi:biotin transporter BioY
MILICLLIYIIGFLITHWVIGPTHDGVEDDDAQRALALLWPITGFILIAALPVFILRQINKLKK